MKALILCVALAAGWNVACSKKDEEGKGNGGGGGSDIQGLHFGKMNLMSSHLATAAFADDGSLEDCGFSLDIYRGEGSCLTPLEVKGYAGTLEATISSVGNTDTIKGSARIAGVEGGSQQEAQIFGGAEFDFASPESFTAHNELWNQYETKTSYEYVATELVYQKIKFKLKDKFVTLLLPSYDQPFQDSDLLDECEATDEERAQERYAAANLLEGMTFKRGDYLFCVKDALADACAAADYKWLDVDAIQLVAERPDNPRVHAYLHFDKASCKRDNGRINPSIPGIRIGAKLDSKFKLYADFSHGINSTQWPEARGPRGAEPDPDHLADENFEEPYLIYYHETADGAQATGTGLKGTFDFDVTKMMYLDGLRASDVDSGSLEQALAKIFAKHDWVFHKKAEEKVVGFGVEQYYSMNVTAAVELSGGMDRPTEEP